MSQKTAKARQKPRKKITYTPCPLPDQGFVRLPSVLAVLGISKTSFLDGIKSGKYPPGKLLSPRCRVWAASSIRELLTSIENDEIAA
jgi:predicted DNA-binding transcriptional regulator AlpA